MGDPENKDEFGWYENKKWKKNQERILLNGIKVPCVSLVYEIEINKQIGNYNAFRDTDLMDFYR
ncbi:hypothetical protein QRZ28_26445 [Raoultella ornithinolytica]|nr:hypothetical protein [Raoultella ornithinolytica]MDL4585388.1 hypothetical protein [Raoultella ornithinolytica]